MKQKEQTTSSRPHNARLHRNMRERERRSQMKDLYSQLASVIHPQPFKAPSVPELIDKATSYVKDLQERIENLKLQKAFYESIVDVDVDDQPSTRACPSPKRPKLDVQSWDSSKMEVNLVCGADNKALLYEYFRIFQEEGAEVVGLASHNVGDNVIYTIMAQAIILRIGIDSSRIHERLQEITY